MTSPHKPDAAMVKARHLLDALLRHMEHPQRGDPWQTYAVDMIAAALREPPAPSEDVEALAFRYAETQFAPASAEAFRHVETFKAGYKAARQDDRARVLVEALEKLANVGSWVSIPIEACGPVSEIARTALKAYRGE